MPLTSVQNWGFGTVMGGREVPVGPRKTKESTPSVPITLESGSDRERFSTIVPSKAQPARRVAMRREARRLKRIENEV